MILKYLIFKFYRKPEILNAFNNFCIIWLIDYQPGIIQNYTKFAILAKILLIYFAKLTIGNAGFVKLEKGVKFIFQISKFLLKIEYFFWQFGNI